MLILVNVFYCYLKTKRRQSENLIEQWSELSEQTSERTNEQANKQDTMKMQKHSRKETRNQQMEIEVVGTHTYKYTDASGLKCSKKLQ